MIGKLSISSLPGVCVIIQQQKVSRLIKAPETDGLPLRLR